MPISKRGYVVRVPFPYSNRDIWQHRPALVISDRVVGTDGFLLWVLMITSARNRPWPGDVPIPDSTAAGLPVPSVVRTAKIATADLSSATSVGTLPDEVMATVDRELHRILGWG